MHDQAWQKLWERSAIRRRERAQDGMGEASVSTRIRTPTHELMWKSWYGDTVGSLGFQASQNVSAPAVTILPQ